MVCAVYSQREGQGERKLHPRYDDALGRVRESPGDAYAHLMLGLALTDRKDYPAALAEIRRAQAMGLSSGSAQDLAQVYCGIGMARTGQKDPAMREWRAVLARMPYDPHGVRYSASAIAYRCLHGDVP
jgi:hypothetical protein